MRPRRLNQRYLDRLENSIEHAQASGLNIVKRGSELSISARRDQGGGRSSTGLRWAKLIDVAINETVHDDYLVGRLWDPATDTYGTEDIIIAKPHHLMRSLFDGGTIEYVGAEGGMAVLTYDDNAGGIIRHVELTPATGSGGVQEFDELVTPRWYEGELIRIEAIPATFIGVTAEATGTFSYGTLFANRVTRASGSFVTDGFEVGMTLTVSGTSNNDGEYEIASVGALFMTVTGGTFTSETVASTMAGTSGVTAHWRDVNREGRKFEAPQITGGTLEIVAGTPDILRLTLTGPFIDDVVIDLDDTTDCPVEV